MKLALKLVPQPVIARGERFLRDFEWTWTKAVLAALVLWLAGIWLIAQVPSWWLYFASDKLGWRPCPCPSTTKFWLFILRDVIASMLFGIPFGGFIMVPYYLQRTRRRLRSESESRPVGGYR